jgi:hypothetical protein
MQADDRMRRRGTGKAAILLALTLGCHADLTRLAAQGRYDEVIARAQASRLQPRGKAARAFAQALVARDQTERARHVLLHDFRRGGEVESLVAAADLERRLGLDGMAAHHYVRVTSKDHKALRGRTDVCDLLRRRAQALLELGEGLAAEQDMQRVGLLCGEPPGTDRQAQDGRLSNAIDVAADAQVDREIAQTRCPRPDCSEARGEERIAAVEGALERAAKDGPEALLRTSLALQARLPPADVMRVLDAELRGKLGTSILLDDALRTLIGDQGWSELARTVMSQGPESSAFAQLRLARLLPDVPIAPSSPLGPSQLERWSDLATAGSDVHAWRVYAWRGDLSAAELALSGDLRSGEQSPRPVTPAEDDAPGPDHWAAHIELTATTLPLVLVEARLRRAAGHEDLALALTRFSIQRAHAAGVPDAAGYATQEATRALAWGRPWHALAIVEALPAEILPDVRSAAATGVVLSQLVCGGPCRDDDDRDTVTRVMGERWTDAWTRRARDEALAQRHSLPAADGCPTAEEVLAPDATGPLTEALRAAQRQPNEGGTADALQLALESDITMVCAARWVLPILAHAGYELTAARLADMLAQAPEMVAASQLLVHAQLALVAGQSRRAELLSTAAWSAAARPEPILLELAQTAEQTGNRQVYVDALQELLLRTPGLDNPAVQRALVLVALRDVGRSWSDAHADAGRQAVQRHVDAYLKGYAAAQRFAQRDALIEAVAEAPWLTDALRPVLVQALAPGDDTRRRHATALRSLLPAVDPPGETGKVGPFDIAELARRVRRGNGEIPPATEVFAEPSLLERLRLAVAEHDRTWSNQWRIALGLATYGTKAARARGLRQLLEMADSPDQRRSLQEFVVQRPAALQPALFGEAPKPVPVAARDALLGSIFGLRGGGSAAELVAD